MGVSAVYTIKIPIQFCWSSQIWAIWRHDLAQFQLGKPAIFHYGRQGNTTLNTVVIACGRLRSLGQDASLGEDGDVLGTSSDGAAHGKEQPIENRSEKCQRHKINCIYKLYI